MLEITALVSIDPTYLLFKVCLRSQLQCLQIQHIYCSKYAGDHNSSVCRSNISIVQSMLEITALVSIDPTYLSFKVCWRSQLQCLQIQHIYCSEYAGDHSSRVYRSNISIVQSMLEKEIAALVSVDPIYLLFRVCWRRRSQLSGSRDLSALTELTEKAQTRSRSENLDPSSSKEPIKQIIHGQTSYIKIG